MRWIKIIGILLLVYAGVVALFESLLGYFQPANQATLVITTNAGDGDTNSRVLARMVHDEELYVAANHWPRAWYRQALADPNVQVTFDGTTTHYRAVSVEEAEHQRVDSAYPLGIGFRILTGFPPRYFLRLDPLTETQTEPPVG